MATVHVPALLRELTGGAARIEVALPPDQRITVRELLARLDAQHPGFAEALLYEGDLMPGIAVFIDNDQAPMGLLAKVDAASVVHFVPPVAGGR